MIFDRIVVYDVLLIVIDVLSRMQGAARAHGRITRCTPSAQSSLSRSKEKNKRTSGGEHTRHTLISRFDEVTYTIDAGSQ